MDVLTGEDIERRLRDLFRKAERYVKIASPWVKGEVLRDLLSEAGDGVRVEVILRASSEEDLSITDPGTFLYLKERKGEVFLNPRIHAKVFIVDGREAVVGSANLTPSGVRGQENLEVALHLKGRSQVKDLEEFFERAKAESYNLSKTVGIVFRTDSAREGELVLVREVQEQTYVRVPLTWGFLLGRITRVRSPGPEEDLTWKRLPQDRDWRAALLIARSLEREGLRLGRFEILGEYERERDLFKVPTTPVIVGAPVEILDPKDRDLLSILRKNHSGYPMSMPVYVGKLMGSEVEAFLDMDKVVSMHMAVLGTTGSGKTTFVRKILGNLENKVELFLFDMYGEYVEHIGGRVRHLVVPNILLPTDWEDLKKILREGGVNVGERTAEEKDLAVFMRRSLKPDLTKTSLRERSLEEVIREGIKGIRDAALKESVEEAIEFFKEMFGPESVRDQPLLIKELAASLRGDQKRVIYDFREVDLSETRVAVGGLVLREVLRLVKKKPGDRLVVIEEAHNFAPERGTGEVQMGRENLAYLSLRRIAMEGRKFRIGLIAITQRPANISKFILSQLNTQVIFKLITRNDLEAVSVFFEHSKEDIFRLLPFLKPGTAFITGLAVPFGFLFHMEEIPYW